MSHNILRSVCLMAALSIASLEAAGGASVRLIDAVKQGNRTAVRSLISEHTNVNATEPDGMTALHWAVRANDVETSQMLIRAGANVKAVSRYGIAPIMLAAQNGSLPLVEALLKAGADPNSAQVEGETVL